MARTIDTLAAKLPYNKKEIMNRVSQISIENKNGTIITKDGDVLLSTWKPSKIYEVVNFKDAVKAMLNVAENIFNPECYNLTFKAGYQELKLRGGSHKINGEVFHEMIWLTNSTDGTKRLSVRYGLMRQICSNGACVTHSGSSFKVKHLTSNNVNEELKSFMMELPKLNVTKQVKVLKAVAKKTVTIGHLADSLVNGIGTAGNDKIWGLLARKLSSSKTDRLGDKYDAAVSGIKVSYADMTKETKAIEIPAWTALQCYTELWRSLDAGEIERETNKILEIIN